LGLGRFFSSLILYTVGRTPWTERLVRWKSARTAQAQNKRTETSMPHVGLEPTIPVFKRAKTVHTLNRAATVIGISSLLKVKLFPCLINKDIMNAFQSS
jgi:hypothetical protein